MKGLGIKIKHVDNVGNPGQAEQYEERIQIFTECINSILQKESELDIDVAINRATETMK